MVRRAARCSNGSWVLGSGCRPTCRGFQTSTQHLAPSTLGLLARAHDAGCVGPSSWTDAYVATFARTYSCLLVIFDNGFARWAELMLKLLAIPEKSSGK